MTTADITALLRTAFGAEASVRVRRPNRVYQINVPAYLADGDGAAIFVEPGSEGRLRMTDLGQTAMRLSYTRASSEASEKALERLADRHGFELVDGSLVAEVSQVDIVAGALGLIQIESEAEAAIATSITRRTNGELFRKVVRDAILEAFGAAATIGYHLPGDAQALWSIDAKIEGASTSLFVVVVPSELEAERSIASKFHIQDALRKAPGRPQHWLAVARDINALGNKSRLRLMKEYVVPVPRFDDDPKSLAPKLREFAA